jgi:predicted nucleic acid-binding protein
MLFIYWLEDHPVHGPQIQQIYERMQDRKDILCTSGFAVGEILTGQLKWGMAEAADATRSFFKSSAVEVAGFTVETAERYARIRATNKVSPADAIHLACAAQTGTDLFLTNDQRLRGLIVPGIQFISGMSNELL